MSSTDVIVCGGGPAGLAAGIACRMRGLEVVVVENGCPPVDKACGEGLLPEALASLNALGVDLRDVPTATFRGIRFQESGGPAAEAAFRNSVALGVRRRTLHEVLIRRAEQIGVQLRWGAKVLGVTQRRGGVDVRTSAGEFSAAWCFGADGAASQVRRWTGLEGGTRSAGRIGLRRHYAVAPWSAFMEVHWGRHGQAYVTPTSDHEVSVAVIARRRFGSVADALGDFPELACRLEGAGYTSNQRGSGTGNRTFRRVTAGRVALVGDASGSVDAITGTGLGLAFDQALALAEAVHCNDLPRYEAAHRRIRKRALLVAQGLLLLDRSTWLRRMALASFRRNPKLFEQMLAIHSGAAPLAYLGSGGALTLGVQVLFGL